MQMNIIEVKNWKDLLKEAIDKLPDATIGSGYLRVGPHFGRLEGQQTQKRRQIGEDVLIKLFLRYEFD